VGGEHRRACERRFRRYPDLTAALSLSLVWPLSGTQRYCAVLRRPAAVWARCASALGFASGVLKEWGALLSTLPVPRSAS
jgi:hypothetical protein